NPGGESFPSPILSVYCAPGEPKGEVLVVDGFERLSGPVRIETADSLGFDLDSDIGVAYMSTRCWAGRQIGFSPQQAGREGVGSLGYCGNELTGKTIAGNTFDGAVVHGEAIISATGYSYSSCTKQALTKGDISMTGYSAVDYVAGLERDAPHNLLPYKSFSPHIQQLLTQYLQGGGRLMVSGAYIGSDMTSPTDSAFTTNVLKYRFAGTVATESDTLQGLNRTFCIYRTPCEEHCAAQHPDIIVPADETAFSAFAYANGMSAGTAYRGEQYRVLAMGFPFECIRNVAMRNEAMEAILRFLCE
ncbi:MAG: xanthan lyase, partial [Bacteroidaceae bacterium]|nr:xanthan lyase [Bacteroidaceae bacterium]